MNKKYEFKRKWKGTSQNTKSIPYFDVIEEHLIEGKRLAKEWNSLIIVFRTINKKSEISRARISIRKYFRDKRIQNFNINNIREARALLKLIIKYFPEATIE